MVPLHGAGLRSGRDAEPTVNALTGARSCDSQSRHQSAVEAAILEAAGQNTACGGAGHNKGLKHSFVCYLLVNEAVWIHTRHHQDVAAGIVSYDRCQDRH
jgi:hypothetical protein